jgi:chemotaxis protein CheC
VTATLPLTERQRDALRELTNVGAGHAATSLSQLLSGARLSFQAPEVWGWTEEAFQARLLQEAPWVAGVLDVQGGVRGALWLLFGQKDGQAFAAQLFSAAPATEAVVESAVVRATQAMGASALSAMGRLTGLTLTSGAPVLRRSGSAGPSDGAGTEAPLLVLEVRLRAPAFAAQFLFVPGGASLGALLRSLRV